ncbi:hypothetical protein ALC60_14552 [Trachymyrmex zeteki]|uniref:Uncharacterized protein n=1 Tax=Mycetomoellerius zeteki TaxID=64791 RepID=A0A151WF67_9HYME|nr:hypothetical protein ALC60_14552 [Trachymyrmex zeteki]
MRSSLIRSLSGPRTITGRVYCIVNCCTASYESTFSSLPAIPDDETSANAFKCGRRLVTQPAQGDAHLQFESAVNIEILEFTPTNLASHSRRAHSPLRQYYVCMIWDNFPSGHLVFIIVLIRNTPSADFRSESSRTIKSSLNQKEDIKDKGGQNNIGAMLCMHTYIDSDRMSVTANDDENDDSKMRFLTRSANGKARII